MAKDLKLEDLDLSKAASLSSSELESLGLNKKDIFSAQQKATFMADKTLGIGQGAITSKQVDNKTIDSYINEIEKPTGSDVYSKQAAMYRAQGEGQVLRTQKNLSNLFGPTINLLKEREAASIARYTILKERMPEFDDSVIFGEGGVDKTPMPIADEIKSISSSVKEDLRMLSRLNPNDERYDEIRKRVEKNQENIVKFDEINKKLLQIRNEGTDQSQWSTGMTDTERDMWLDIYSSNGKNIKIQDGKLVWTDTRGETKYKFDDISDRGPKKEALGYTSDGYDNSSDLGLLHFLTMDGNKPGDREYFEDALNSSEIEYIQKSLNNLGFTDDNGKKLDVDGNFGDKTQEALNKYLAKKDELEQAYLDENLSEEDKQKYGSTVEGSVGETRVIDLEFIKSGPTMISNEATVMDMTMRGNAQAFINSGGEVGSESYIQLIQQPLFEMNRLPNEDMKSLIFDGLNTNDKDLFTGMNTNDFLEGVIRNHYGEDLSQEEIQEKIELIRSGDVTQQYKDGKGGTSTLRTQFMTWYKGKIDEKIEAGKKDPLIGGIDGEKGKGKGKGKGSETGNSDFDKDFTNFSKNWISSTKGDEDFSFSTKLPTVIASGYTFNDAEFVVADSKFFDKVNDKGVKALNSTEDSEKIFQIHFKNKGDIEPEIRYLNIKEAAKSLSEIYGITQKEALAFLENSVKDIENHYRNFGNKDGSGLTPFEIAQKQTKETEERSKQREQEKKNAAGRAQLETLQNVNANFAVRSDVRLKENVKHVGYSNNNIPIYEFNYINSTTKHSGTMAQDLIKIGRSDAVTLNDDGYYSVDYNLIDVNFNTFK